ncbi:MAG: hypothetical protein ABW133_13960 [Polyangiaceae bacterium]
MSSWVQTFGAPPDAAAAVALGGALVLIWQGPRIFAALLRAPKKLAIGVLALTALALSAGYVQFYLRGGPRIIDATSYWLEARALAEGHATWPIDEPTASVRGRFLLMSGTTEAPRLGVIFPPGYPLLLAVGFCFGVPLFIGPLIAALLVIATYALGKAVSARDDVARIAATLSVLSATLRYHTADTMSHGLAALLFASTLALGFIAVDTDSAARRRLSAAGAGVLFGWLVATRPVSALALVPALLVLTYRISGFSRLLLAAGAALPIALFVLQQRAVTGSLFVSSQNAYYAVADGPPGCFRYGFGAGIGCLHEHGSFVDAALPHGLDARAAIAILLKRLRLHVADIANFEPLALLVIAAPFLARSRATNGSPLSRRSLVLALTVLAIFAAYVPFYFDGSYPGGGARFFADVLPLEHVLAAVALVLAVDRARTRFPSINVPRAAALLGAIALAGFGTHTSLEHGLLRDREGGRPFFEPRVLREAKVDRGLLFVGTDHAFNLAYDPAARDANQSIVVAHEYGDDRDRLMWERLGRPTAHRYVFEGRGEPAVVPWAPGPTPHPFRFEAEAEWPPVRQSGGAFDPIFAHGTCAWGGRLLAVRSGTERPFEGAITFPVPTRGTYRVSVHIASAGDVTARFVLRDTPESPPLATWTFTTKNKELACTTLTEEFVNLAERGWLEVTARGGSKLMIDAVALEPATPVAVTN